jgi:hypothetical protein
MTSLVQELKQQVNEKEKELVLLKLLLKKAEYHVWKNSVAYSVLNSKDIMSIIFKYIDQPYCCEHCDEEFQKIFQVLPSWEKVKNTIKVKTNIISSDKLLQYNRQRTNSFDLLPQDIPNELYSYVSDIVDYGDNLFFHFTRRENQTIRPSSFRVEERFKRVPRLFLKNFKSKTKIEDEYFFLYLKTEVEKEKYALTEIVKVEKGKKVENSDFYNSTYLYFEETYGPHERKDGSYSKARFDHVDCAKTFEELEFRSGDIIIISKTNTSAKRLAELFSWND